jgi:Rrf2 family protein
MFYYLCIMLSKKTRYAMMALIRLAREYGSAAPTAISEIADSEHIPPRFLEGIMLRLKKMGLVESARGKSGGYMLAKDPGEIRLATIISTFEGSVGMLACVCPHSYRPCEFAKDEESCKLRRTFKYIHESTFGILENTSLRDLI